MKRLLLIAFILTVAHPSFSQNYLLLGTGTTGPTGTGNSVIYQDPATSNIGIGNASPGAVLDVSGPISLGFGTSPSIINPEYLYLNEGLSAGSVPLGSPNYFVASRVGYGLAFPVGPVYGPQQIDFMINDLGQTAIGDASYTGVDFRIHTHGWPTLDNPLDCIEIDDDGTATLFAIQNVGTSAYSAGWMELKTNSGLSGMPALSVLDAAHTLNPILQVTSDGLISIGVDPGVGAAAQLDVMLNTSAVDNLFHVGTYGPGATMQNYFNINNNGSIGINNVNPGDALLEISQPGSPTPGEPLLELDNGAGNLFLTVNGSSGSSGGTSLSLFSGSNTGWPTQIQFWNSTATAERHLITDDFGTGNLLIWPGWDASASNVLEVAGNGQVDGNMQVNGTMRIGSTQSDSTLPNAQFANYQLSVDGQIASKELIVQVMSWSDTVFSNTYQLKPLREVQEYIQQHKHLPEVPDERDVMQNGVSVGQMNATLLKKVEELTLYALQQQQQINEMQEQLNRIIK